MKKVRGSSQYSTAVDSAYETIHLYDEVRRLTVENIELKSQVKEYQDYINKQFEESNKSIATIFSNLMFVEKS